MCPETSRATLLSRQTTESSRRARPSSPPGPISRTGKKTDFGSQLELTDLTRLRAEVHPQITTSLWCRRRESKTDPIPEFLRESAKNHALCLPLCEARIRATFESGAVSR